MPLIGATDEEECHEETQTLCRFLRLSLTAARLRRFLSEHRPFLWEFRGSKSLVWTSEVDAEYKRLFSEWLQSKSEETRQLWAESELSVDDLATADEE